MAGRLRTKLGALGAAEHLVTVPGWGYRLGTTVPYHLTGIDII